MGKFLEYFTRVIVVALMGLSLLSVPGHAEGPTTDPEVLAFFSQYTPRSDLQIDHSIWDFILEAIVVDTQDGRGYRMEFGTQNQQPAGTRIGRTATGMKRHVGNRVMYPEMVPALDATVRQYIRELQTIANALPLKELDRAEQIVFWLNLYNASVMTALYKEYPIRTVSDFHKFKADDPSFWYQKNIEISGYALSLSDIENIVFNLASSPLLIYGFWQGTIGGPDLYTRAYTTKNLNRYLKKNALEFVGTGRAVEVKGSTARVSELYEKYAHLFPNFDEDVLTHLRLNADEDTGRQLQKDIKRVRLMAMTDVLADINNGERIIRGASDNPAGLLTARIESIDGGNNGANVAPGGSQNFVQTLLSADFLNWEGKSPDDIPPFLEDYPVNALRRLPTGEIQIYDISEGRDDDDEVEELEEDPVS